MKNKLVIIAYMAVCIFWGSTYLAIKIGIEYFPPFMMAGSRFIIAGLMMLSYGKWKGLAFPKFKEVLPFSIVGILLLTGGNGLVTIAEKTVASGIASLFVAMVPIYIAVLEIIILRTSRLSIIGFLGLFIGFIGVYLLINPLNGSSLISIEGAVMLFLAGLLWSIGSVLSKRLDKKVHIVPSIGIQMLSAGLVLIMFSIMSKEQITTFDLRGIGALFYLIIFGSIIGYSSYIYVLSKWPASKAGTYAYVNPVVAVLLGFIVLDEALNTTMIFSSILILFSVFLVQKSKMKTIN
jgi:drug/metabolite transporter (DMT)-like permease